MDGGNGSIESSLSLDSTKNISHFRSCHIGHFKGVRLKDEFSIQGVKANLRCKSWTCEVCRPMLVKQLRKRIWRGNMTEFVNKGQEKHNHKLLTLTCPGQEWRNHHSPDEAYHEVSDNWDKLRRELKKRFGKSHFLRVVEAQRDGYPHLHVLMVGPGIASKGVLKVIRKLWSYKYFGAFANVDIREVKNYKHAVRYLTKYLLKSEAVYGQKGKKFSTSQGATLKKEKKEWLKARVWMGTVRGKGDNIQIIETTMDPDLPWQLREAEINAAINEVFGDGKHPFGGIV
jgi:hypothetical protein